MSSGLSFPREGQIEMAEGAQAVSELARFRIWACIGLSIIIRLVLFSTDVGP